MSVQPLAACLTPASLEALKALLDDHPADNEALLEAVAKAGEQAAEERAALEPKRDAGYVTSKLPEAENGKRR